MEIKNNEIQNELEKQESVLLHNIANDIIQFELLENGSDKDILGYFGTTGINKGELIRQTIKEFNSDIAMLGFVRSNKKQILKKYGQKDAFEITLTSKRGTV
jgi:hypothetical protein